MAVALDTGKFAEKLEAGGFSTGRVRAAADAFADATGQEPATKAALDALEARLRGEIVALRTKLKAEVAALTVNLAAVKADTLKWIIGAVGLQTVVILAGLARLPSD